MVLAGAGRPWREVIYGFLDGYAFLEIGAGRFFALQGLQLARALGRAF